eukprot:g22266.t1
MKSMGTSLFGNGLALLGGVALGGMFISSRKSGGASFFMLTTSAMGQRGIVCWVLSFIPVADSVPKTMLLFAALTVILIMSNLLATVASKNCPAALSSTVFTGTQMATGYLLDIIIFRSHLSVEPIASQRRFHRFSLRTLTVIGAVLMFCAVVTMALTRLPAKALEATPSARRESRESSLASFAASEFAEVVEEVEVEATELPTAGPRARRSTELPRRLVETSGSHSSAQLSGALSLVLSRNFALQGSALGLLPFIDFFNHHRDDASTATAVSTRVPCTFQERWPGMVAMVAERSIYQGEELTFRYVAAPDSVLLVQYGIAPEGGNRHNLAGVEVFHDDVAKICREKWRVLQSWGWDGHTPLLFTDGLSSRAPLRRFAQLLASVDQEELAAATAVRRGRRRLLISWLLRARARMRLPDLVKDEKDCPLSAAVAAVVAGERDVLDAGVGWKI